MTLPAPFSLIDSEFNAFLFAPIGEEENGMTLSVFSALTRLDVDPWAEAARLADFPDEIAAQALTPLIARLPGARWGQAEARRIAGRLVGLLPNRDPAARPGRVERGGGERTGSRAGVWLICIALLAAAIAGMAANGELPWQ